MSNIRDKSVHTDEIDKNHFGVMTDSLSLEIFFNNRDINIITRFTESIDGKTWYTLVIHNDQKKQLDKLIKRLSAGDYRG